LTRTTARHTDTLTHEELIVNAMALLKPTGRICIILPVNEAEVCKSFALSKEVYCTREVKVIPKPNADAKRILMEFSLQFVPVKLAELVIESNERHHYSDEFSELAKEFISSYRVLNKPPENSYQKLFPGGYYQNELTPYNKASTLVARTAFWVAPTCLSTNNHL